MKKLLAESLNEWKFFNKMKGDAPKWPNEGAEDPYEREYTIGKQIRDLFIELGFEDAEVSSLGRNVVAILSEHSNFMFLIKSNGDIYYEGVEFTAEQKSEKIGNINDPKGLKIELEKILV